MLEGFTWYKQAAYLWRGDGVAVYIDPWGVTGDVPADVLFITHAHFDHFSMEDIERVRKDDTEIFAPTDVAEELSGNVTPVQPGDSIQARSGTIRGEAVHAYNVAEERLEMHPKANRWVGFVLELGGRTYYHAGDTDHAPELDAVRADVAFVPIGGTFTMDVAEAAGFVKVIRPSLAVPMHYGWVEGTGTASEGDRFRREAAPIEVRTLEPAVPFEFTGS